MAGNLSAFGYTVPLTVVFVFVALVIGLALAVMFWLTLGWSVVQSVGSTRREQVRDELQREFLERAFDPDSEWEAWADDFSGVERDVVESLLDEHLRELEGKNADRLRELGDVLGIPERSKRQLNWGNEYTRLHALTWLTVLERPGQARDFEPRTPRERALVARLRYDSDTGTGPADEMGVLLDGASTPFSVFGQDTMYRIATADPQALLERATAHSRRWPQPLLVQVLTVCQHLGTSVTSEDLSWLTATLEHESDAVREAGARALGAFGWRADVRDDRFLARLIRDPSPKVRGAVYEMLSRWGDEQALETLVAALGTEQNERATLTGTNALVAHRSRLEDDTHLGASWAWSISHAAYDSAARHRTERVRG